MVDVEFTSTVYAYIDMIVAAGGKPKITPPTQFDGQSLPFAEWATEVRNFLSIDGFENTDNVDRSYNEVNSVNTEHIYQNTPKTQETIDGVKSTT